MRLVLPALLSIPWIAGLAPSSASATPFELIVPSLARISVGSFGSTTNFGSWGWIAPATGTLSDTDLASATFAVTYSDPNVSVTAVGATPAAFTLSPGTFAGFNAAFPNTNNQVFRNAFVGSEALGPRWDYRLTFDTPVGYTGNGTLSATMTIGAQVASWISQVEIAPSNMAFLGVTEQRVASVPEPTTAALASLGLAGLGMRGRKLRRLRLRRTSHPV